MFQPKLVWQFTQHQIIVIKIAASTMSVQNIIQNCNLIHFFLTFPLSQQLPHSIGGNKHVEESNVNVPCGFTVSQNIGISFCTSFASYVGTVNLRIPTTAKPAFSTAHCSQRCRFPHLIQEKENFQLLSSNLQLTWGELNHLTFVGGLMMYSEHRRMIINVFGFFKCILEMAHIVYYETSILGAYSQRRKTSTIRLLKYGYLILKQLAIRVS